MSGWVPVGLAVAYCPSRRPAKRAPLPATKDDWVTDSKAEPSVHAERAVKMKANSVLSVRSVRATRA